MPDDVAAKFLEIEVSRPRRLRPWEKEEAGHERERAQARMEARLKRWGTVSGGGGAARRSSAAGRGMKEAIRALGLRPVGPEDAALAPCSQLSNAILRERRAKQAQRQDLRGQKKQLATSAPRDAVLDTTGHRVIVQSRLRSASRPLDNYDSTDDDADDAPPAAAPAPPARAVSRRTLAAPPAQTRGASPTSFYTASPSAASGAGTPPRRAGWRPFGRQPSLRVAAAAPPTLEQELTGLSDALRAAQRPAAAEAAAEEGAADAKAPVPPAVPAPPATKAELRSASTKLRGHIKEAIDTAARRIRRVRDFDEGFLPLPRAPRPPRSAKKRRSNRHPAARPAAAAFVTQSHPQQQQPTPPHATLEELYDLHLQAVASAGGGCTALGAMQWAISSDPEAVHYAHSHLAHDDFFGFGKPKPKPDGRDADAPDSYRAVSSILARAPKQLAPSRPTSARLARPASAKVSPRPSAPSSPGGGGGSPPPLRAAMETGELAQQLAATRLSFLEQAAQGFEEYNTRRRHLYQLAAP